MRNINLTPKEIETITEAVVLHPEIGYLIVFGSRALGNAKPGSDVDLALVGGAVTSEIVARVREYLEEETLLPYFFDVIHFDSVKSSALREHIMVHGKIIYSAVHDALRVS